jgi:hypothetical protein
MFAEVQPAPAAPPATGLVASALRPNDTGWEAGLAWRPERCITHQEFTPCGSIAGVPAAPDSDVVYYVPPGFRVRDVCTTLDGLRDTARVQRQAAAITSFVVARELWLGTLTEAEPGTVNGSPYVNPYLADGNATDVTAPADLGTAIATLEQAAREAANGQQVFIHVPIAALGSVIATEGLRRVGNILYTATDAVVVADAGYPGTGAPVAGTSEVQTVTITGAPTGGTFTLTFSAQTTGTIPFDAVGATVQTSLNALPNLDGVVVTGVAGGPYTVTFPADMGNVAQMTGNGAGLTGGVAPAVGVVTATPGVAPSTEPGTWIYATGPVQVRLTPVAVIDDPAQTVDREPTGKKSGRSGCSRPPSTRVSISR